jgi:hypothetical protein
MAINLMSRDVDYRRIRMNELLRLEPRVAGEDVAEPETDLTYRSDDRHMARCICDTSVYVTTLTTSPC